MEDTHEPFRGFVFTQFWRPKMHFFLNKLLYDFVKLI